MKPLENSEDQIFTTIAHQIKNPLTPILGWADALEDPKIMGSLTPNQLRAISIISHNAGKLDNIIENLLDAHKLSRDEMIYDSCNFKPSEIFSSLSRYYKKILTDNKITLIINQHQSLIIKGDKRRIVQIITNLVDYVLSSLPEESGRIELNVEPKGKLVEFKINYNSSKISREIKETILEKSYDRRSFFKREYDDPAFGLKICRGLVEGMGGSIWLNSDKESIDIYFTLPNIV